MYTSSFLTSDDNMRMTACQLLDMPYVSGIDPLDTSFFNFKAFYDEVEENFKTQCELESSDEYIDTE